MSNPLIEKIRKLLALATSDNANEAAAAAAKAQRLMVEHSIDASQLGDGQTEEKVARSGEPLITFGAKLPSWLDNLSAGLSRMNHVYSFIARQSDGSRGIVLIGTPTDVENVRFLFAYLRSEIERLAQKHARGGGRAYANSYRIGATVGALEAMKKEVASVRASTPGEALVRIDARYEEAKAVMSGVAMKKRGGGSVGSRDGFVAGVAAGRHLHGSKPLGAGGVRMLGGK